MESPSKYIQKLERELHMYKESMSQYSKDATPESRAKMVSSLSYPIKQSRVQKIQSYSHDNMYEHSLHEQIERATHKYTDKCKEYEKLYNKYLTAQNQITSLQEYAEDIERERKFLADKLSDIEIHAQGDEMVGELQNKLVLMSTQIIRLGNLSRSKSQEVTSLSFKLKELIKQLENKEDQVNERDRLVAQYRQKVRSLQKKIYDIEANKQYEGDSNFKILSQELERLNGLLLIKNQEINSLQYKIHALQSQEGMTKSRVMGKNIVELQLQVEKYQKSNSMMKETVEELEQKIRKLRRDKQEIAQQNDRYFKQVKMLELEISDYASKMNKVEKNHEEHIRIDIEYRESIIQQQKEQIDRMKEQYKSRKESDKEFSQKQRKKFQEQIFGLRQQLNRNQQIINSFHQRLSKFQEKIILFSQEVERLAFVNNNVHQEYQTAKQMLVSKTQQLNQSEQLNRLLESEANDYKKEVQKMRKQMEDMWMKNIQLERHASQNRYLQEEIQILSSKLDQLKNLNNRLQQKIYELESSNESNRLRQIQGILNKQREYFSQKQEEIIISYEKSLKNLDQDNQILNQKLKTMIQQHSSAQNNYLMLAQEIQRLNKILSEYSETILTQKRQISTLENKLEISTNTAENIKKMYVHSDKISQLVDEKVQVYRNQLTDKQGELNRAYRKIDAIEINLSQYQRQNMQMKDQNMDLEQKINKKQSEVASLISELSILQSTHSQLLILISQIKQSNNRLELKIQALTKHNCQMAESDRLARKSLENDRVRAQEEARGFQDQVHTLREQNIKKEGEIRALLEKTTELKGKIESYEEQIAKFQININQKQQHIQNTLRDYDQQLEKLRRIIQQQENQMKAVQSDKFRENDAKRKIQLQKIGLQSQLKSLRQQNNRQFKKEADKNSQLRALLSDKENEISHYKNKLDEINRHHHENKMRFQKLVYSYEQKNSEAKQLQEAYQHERDKFIKKQNQFLDLQNKYQKEKGNRENLMEEKNKVQLLSNEVGRLNTVLCQNIEEVNDLQNLIKRYQQQIQSKNSLISDLKMKYRSELGHKAEQLEGVLKEEGQLSLKLELAERKLADERSQYAKQLVQFKQQISYMGEEKANLMKSVTDLKSENKRLIQEMQDLQMQKYSIQGRSQMRYKQIQENKNHYEKRMNVLINQNESLIMQLNGLKKQVREKQNEINRLRKEIQCLREQENSYSENLQRQKNKWINIQKKLREQIQQLLGDRQRNKAYSGYEQKILRLQAIIKDYQGKIALMSQEIERLNLINTNLQNARRQDGRSNNFNDSIYINLKANYEEANRKISDYQFKIRKLKEEFELLNRLAHEYKEENDMLREKNHSKCIFVGGIYNHEEAISTPSDAINRKKSNSEDFLVRKTLSSEIDRLTLLNQSLQTELNEYKHRKTSQEVPGGKYEETLSLVVLLKAQVDSLRSRLMQQNSRPPAYSGTSSNGRQLNNSKSPIKINLP